MDDSVFETLAGLEAPKEVDSSDPAVEASSCSDTEIETGKPVFYNPRVRYHPRCALYWKMVQDLAKQQQLEKLRARAFSLWGLFQTSAIVPSEGPRVLRSGPASEAYGLNPPTLPIPPNAFKNGFGGPYAHIGGASETRRGRPTWTRMWEPWQLIVDVRLYRPLRDPLASRSPRRHVRTQRFYLSSAIWSAAHL